MRGRLQRTFVLLLGLGAVTGCGVHMEPLMPTPVVFTERGLDPLAHIPARERWIPRRVYYATNRKRSDNFQRIDYGNAPSTRVSLGLALIGFGDSTMTWSDLARISTSAERADRVDLSIAGIVEAGHFETDSTLEEAAGPTGAGWLLEDLNDAIDDSRDDDVLVYVHGAKVNFYNACAFAAQLDHFMGRDMTSLAFAWPTRQNILSYGLGSDVNRAYQAAESLASLLELVAAETDARRIHVLSWSAGGRVTTRALALLRERHAGESDDAVRTRLRLGTVYFAAGDVPTSEFIEALPAIHAIVERPVVTASDDDGALKSASLLMGGGGRIGQTGSDITPEQVELILSMDRLELINVSRGQESRGFDITGHRYWFNHPWASSDVLVAIRTDLKPAERGLAQAEYPISWAIPDDYPLRLQKALSRVGLRRW